MARALIWSALIWSALIWSALIWSAPISAALAWAGHTVHRVPGLAEQGARGLHDPA
jgi:hypothetical protein